MVIIKMCNRQESSNKDSTWDARLVKFMSGAEDPIGAK